MYIGKGEGRRRKGEMGGGIHSDTIGEQWYMVGYHKRRRYIEYTKSQFRVQWFILTAASTPL